MQITDRDPECPECGRPVAELQEHTCEEQNCPTFNEPCNLCGRKPHEFGDCEEKYCLMQVGE